MTAFARIWYIALGAAATWAWHRSRQAPAESVVTVVVGIPTKLLPSMIAGVAAECQGILLGDILPGTPDAGIDPTTGLPGIGNPGDAPDDEQ